LLFFLLIYDDDPPGDGPLEEDASIGGFEGFNTTFLLSGHVFMIRFFLGTDWSILQSKKI